MPSRSATLQASASAAMVAPATRLLQSFAAWPAPAGPTWTTRLPSASSSGRCAAKAPLVPPTMTVSEAASAPAGPPLTRASRDSIPARASPTASAHARAASAGVAATGSPRSAALAGSASTATSSCPAAARFRAIGSPIVPRPMNATRVMPSGGAGCELAAEGRQPRERASRRGQGDPDDDLVVARGVGYPHLERLVVGADRVVVLVLEGEVDRSAGRAALLRGRNQGAAAD